LLFPYFLSEIALAETYYAGAIKLKYLHRFISRLEKKEGKNSPDQSGNAIHLKKAVRVNNFCIFINISGFIAIF
jgi:hypothetical protein